MKTGHNLSRMLKRHIKHIRTNPPRGYQHRFEEALGTLPVEQQRRITTLLINHLLTVMARYGLTEL